MKKKLNEPFNQTNMYIVLNLDFFHLIVYLGALLIVYLGAPLNCISWSSLIFTGYFLIPAQYSTFRCKTDFLTSLLLIDALFFSSLLL